MSEKMSKMVRLGSSEGEVFEVAEDAIGAASGMIRGLLEEDCATDADVIPLPNVKAPVLVLVLDYVNKHFLSDKDDEDALKRFDGEFVQVDQPTLFDLILAANYLSIQGLLDLMCQRVADMMKGKKPEEIREIFHIRNDYTWEEEDEVRKENSWAFTTPN